MADADVEAPLQHKRKSVAFSEGTTLIDSNGQIKQVNGEHEDKDTAQHHSQSNGEVKEIDEATAAFEDLALKKKKKKSSKPKEGEDKNEDADAPVGDDEFNPAALKKKKKKKVPKADADDFEAKLAEKGVKDKDADEDEDTPAAPADDGDMDEGTGVWAHDATQPINYDLLLDRFFKLLNAHNPDLGSVGLKSHKIPPPQCLREGNKKTIFANISEICKRLKRSDEHVTQFLLAEMGTHGSTDGSRRLVIKGKFAGKQIESVLRRYIMEYVTCKTCRSPDTELVRGENRLYFVTCNSCGSRRSVQAIRSGYTAQIGKRRRQQG